ncbi:DNA methyltransferase [Halopenitus sp. H-Gu1]|uniref:DNA methyltransferase n=1 Tax=Halopenitus sp. H-Gu1 TaxID=3242697 RepID=UPI00359CF940
MRTVRMLPSAEHDPLPEWCTVDVRSVPTLPAWAIEEFSEPGATVLDPFAGFGTTLRAAQRLDREAYGIELEERRVEYIRDRLSRNRDRPATNAATDEDEGTRVVVGDAMAGPAAFHEAGIDPPVADLVYTAPPYMLEGTDTDPLTNYRGSGSYEGYLSRMTMAFEAITGLLDDDATIVVEASNLRAGPAVTMLAWDLAEAIDHADGYRFRVEIVVGFDESEDSQDRSETNESPGSADPDDGSDPLDSGRYGYGYDHCYCLVFDRLST